MKKNQIKPFNLSCFLPFIVLFYIALPQNAYAKLVPSGKTVGIKLYTKGLIVTEICDFLSSDGKQVSPAKDAGIKIGDIINSVDGNELVSSVQFQSSLHPKDMHLEIARGNEILNVTLMPELCGDGHYRVGMWVRDSSAGIGTITCFDDETMEFFALGHAITDVDTGNIMTVNKGNIQECFITSVTMGKYGLPGSITAEFNGENIGIITKNQENGISGKLDKNICEYSQCAKAEFGEITDGDAYILSDVAGNGIKSYAVKLKKLDRNGTKNMSIEITDSELLNLTGGIVQGMSGSPVIQNGKLVGAVTHVFVNDPTKGYGIFIENMLTEAEKIE